MIGLDRLHASTPLNPKSSVFMPKYWDEAKLRVLEVPEIAVQYHGRTYA